MNRKIKKIVALSLVMIMVFAFVGPLNAFAESPENLYSLTDVNDSTIIEYAIEYKESADTAVGVPLETPAFAGNTAGTWFETAWATWTGNPVGGYTAFVRLRPGQHAYYWRTGEPINDPAWDIALGWVEVDSELVRLVDPARGTWRVDIQGLPRGSYDVEIRDAGGTVVHEFGNLQTTSFHRYGAAFVPSSELVGNSATTNFALNGATGGYLSDGRIDPNAVVMYVSHGDWGEFTIANLNRDSALRNNNPIVVRFIGTIGTFDWNLENAEVPINARAANRMMTLQTNSHQLTIEGVGPDAAMNGWGLFTGGAVNVVIRNLHVSGFFQQGFRASGNTTNFWVHNNTFHYGQNRFFHNDEETDRTMGQGSVDIEQNVRGYTISFNHFNGGRGTNLIVGSVQNWNLDNNGHRHYGTLHHNIYDSAQERNPRTRHHNLHMFNNLFRDVLGHPLHYRLLDRYTGYGIGAAHNATIWAEGNIFDDVGFPFLRSRHGHARGYYPHTGHNHFWPDGPGFIVTGDNVDFSGASVGRMPMPVFGEWGYRNTVRGLNTQADFDTFAARVNNLQPNVMCSGSASTFNSSLDVGITVDQAATMMMPPVGDILYPAPGFPALNANANTHGWGFEGDFIPSTSPADVWSTGTPAEVAELREFIEANAGAMPSFVPAAPMAAPANITISLNELDFFMHRHGSPTPSLRTIDYAGTFTINWTSNDVLTQGYEIQYQDNGVWRTLHTVTPRITQIDLSNTFVTQDMSDFGYLIMQGGGHDWVAVHLGGNGHVVMYPNVMIGHSDAPLYDESDIPAVEDLTFTAPWVIADLKTGGTYNFRMRAVNAVGESSWATFSYTVQPNSAHIVNIWQTEDIPEINGIIEPANVLFNVRTVGIPDGTYDISLSVPRSVARNVFPWPAQRNFSGDIFLEGATGLVTGNPSPKTGNGGTGQLVIENGVGTITVVVDANIPVGPHDLVLTIMVNGNPISQPFWLGYVPCDDATLSSLEIVGRTITPAFTPNELAYTLTVPNNVTSVTVNAEATHPRATVTIAGGDNLAVGENIVTVTVTAEDGTTMQTYTIVVTRQEPPPTNGWGGPPPTGQQPGQQPTAPDDGDDNGYDEDDPDVPLDPPPGFVDVPTHWAREAIEFVHGRGLMIGVSDTMFAPDAVLTRAMMATILWRLEGEPSTAFAPVFSDVPAGRWYSEAIVWASEQDIVRGIGGGLFDPHSNITREQFAAMMHRYAIFIGVDTEVPATHSLAQFTDQAQVGAWALDYVMWANYNELLTGVTATTLVPRGNVTRAQCATVLHRFIVRLERNGISN